MYRASDVYAYVCSIKPPEDTLEEQFDSKRVLYYEPTGSSQVDGLRLSQ